VGDRVSDLMIRVTTIHASSASASARYYTKYLSDAPGEEPGQWSGHQADEFGLSGTVETEALERLLSGRNPVSGTQLGYPLIDRKLANGRAIKAVAGFDATFSAPKSVSVLWALTGDRNLLEAHDVAVAAALTHLERFGSTTRIRHDGSRLHPDTNGLTFAVFRQTTSRADDPQIHTHAVISAKVRTADGRWLALDAHYLKWYQRMLGGLYQSVLRNEVSHRFGYDWAPIVNGQAEIAGFPEELRAVFSKRGEEVEAALKVKIDEFHLREGRAPTRFERAAMEREAAVDTRGRKSGLGSAELVTRWQAEAAEVGWTAERLREQVDRAGAERSPADPVSVADVVGAVSGTRSSWHRAAIVQAICDLHRPVSQFSGRQWAATIERAADAVLERCIDLDPPSDTVQRRASDGRSVWIAPAAPRFTSNAVLSQEEHIVTWALDAQTDPPARSKTIDRDGLDVLQGEAAAAVAGGDRVVLVVGPAGAGKTRMLAAAVTDLHAHRRPVFGVAPTAKAARVLERDTGMGSDTVAMLLQEWHRDDRPPRPDYRLAAGTTLIVDETGILSTPSLHQLVCLAERQRWRLVLVGDHRQLQAVGRGGLFAELCANGRVEELERLHRFTHAWEAAASLKLRSGDPRALDAYEAHDRIIPGCLDDHLQRMAETWIDRRRYGDTVALVASTNDHADAINSTVQAARVAAGQLDPKRVVRIAGGEHAHVGDLVATRRNDRNLITTTGEPVRNRETWTVMGLGADGCLTVSREQGQGTVTLPAAYVHEHLRLGYAATEHGYQSDTVDHSLSLVSTATTRRGLYVGATRGREDNQLCVVTETDDVTEARDKLEAILAFDRADVPAVTQRRNLAHLHPRETNRQLPVPARRCEIPEWFEPLRAQLCRERDLAEQEATAGEAQRARLAADVADAERELASVEARMAPAREALAAATRHADEARWQRNDAERRFTATGLRGRRAARRELNAAEAREDRAVDYRDRTRQRTAPQEDQYNHAEARVDEAREALYRHDQRARLRHTLGQVPDLRQQVDTLDTWGRWARGDIIDLGRIGDAVAVLASHHRCDEHADQFRALGDAVLDWADHADIELPTSAHRDRSCERAGLEISM
jgi:conjugative relaxase-like TrwC/TraI family protein